ILNLMEEIKWEHLNAKLLQKATRDSQRNVSSQDLGFCGWRNSAADSDHAGMAFPRLHAGTEHPEVAQSLLVLTQILDEAFPHILRDLYSCHWRNKYFAGTIAISNRIETLRHAAGVVSIGGKPELLNFLAGHCDSQNEKEDCR
ncbi:MAG: hypothetical protein ACRCZI_14220, partial [Cetobacterium sp.]